MAGDTYDRELIARMLEALKESPTMRFVTTAVDDQIRLLRDADNREAAGVQTVRLGGDENEWVRVPRVPTPEMLSELELLDGFSHAALCIRYAAMLAAAPAPEDGRGDAIPREIVRDAVVEAILAHPEDADVDAPDFVGEVMDRIDHALAQAERQGEGNG